MTLARRAPGLFVAGVFAGVVGLDAALATEVRDVPYYDLWQWVPWLTGESRPSLAWIWSQHNEHRMPLARLLHVGLARLTGGDLRVATWLMLAILAASVGALLLSLRRARGRASYLDALVPIALLHPGHAEGFLHTFDFTMVLAAAAFTVVLAVVASRERLTARGALVAGLALVAMPLAGSQGLIAAPPMALWLALAAAPSSRSARAVAWSLAALAAGISIACFVAFEIPPHNRGDRPLGAAARCSSEVLSMTFGPAGALSWPVSAVLAAALGAGGLVVAARKLRDPAERARAWGWILALAAVGATIAATGYGRANFPPGMGFGMRYTVSSAPLLVIPYLAAQPPGAGALGRLVAFAAFTLGCVAFSSNAEAGRAYAAQRREEADAYARDGLADLPIDEVARRHARAVAFGDAGELAGWTRQLRDARMGPWRLSGEERVRRIARIAWEERAEYPMLATPPAAVRSSSAPRRTEIAGAPALEVDGPAELRYGVVAGRWRVTGAYEGAAPLVAFTRDPLGGPETAVPVQLSPEGFALELDLARAVLLFLRPEPADGGVRFARVDVRRR